MGLMGQMGQMGLMGRMGKKAARFHNHVARSNSENLTFSLQRYGKKINSVQAFLQFLIFIDDTKDELGVFFCLSHIQEERDTEPSEGVCR